MDYGILPNMKTVLYLQSSDRPSNAAQLSGTMRAAKSLGWNIRIIKFGLASPDHRQHDEEKELKDSLAQMIDFWAPIGVIIDGGGLRKGIYKKYFHLPTVFLDCSPRDVGKGSVCVYSDAADIAQTAARELLALDSRSYGFVPFTVNRSWSRERGREFAAFIHLNKQLCRIFREGQGEADDGNYLSELEAWLDALPKPAAVFAANDFIGELVIRCARHKGLAVPDEIAVMGVDNDEEICLRSSPSLSSIRPDQEKAGYLAAMLLNETIRHPRRPPSSASFGTLAVIHRSSTRRTKRHDDRTTRIIEIIRKHGIPHLSVEQLAKDFGVSRRLIELRFREATGHSIRDEIQLDRLKRSKILLVQSDARLGWIAKESGYPSVQAFRKTFTAATGMSPLRWRKSRQAKFPSAKELRLPSSR